MEILPEFGRHLGYDGKAIDSHSTGQVNRTTGETRVGLALAVMMAMALGHVKAGRPAQMRSLVQPIPATG